MNNAQGDSKLPPKSDRMCWGIFSDRLEYLSSIFYICYRAYRKAGRLILFPLSFLVHLLPVSKLGTLSVDLRSASSEDPRVLGNKM